MRIKEKQARKKAVALNYDKNLKIGKESLEGIRENLKKVLSGFTVESISTAPSSK